MKIIFESIFKTTFIECFYHKNKTHSRSLYIIEENRTNRDIFIQK